MVWEKIINSINNLFKQLAVYAANNKQKTAVACAAVFSVILTLAVILSFSGGNNDTNENRQNEPEQINKKMPIPADQLFLPDEPDFLPGVLVDRERREVWTEDDVMEFWLDPLRAGEEHWREKIDSAVDELLERVP